MKKIYLGGIENNLLGGGAFKTYMYNLHLTHIEKNRSSLF